MKFISIKNICIEDTKAQRGFSLMECLVLMVLFSIMGLGLAYSGIMLVSSRAKAYRSSLCNQIALDRIEEFAAVDPTTLDDTDDSISTVTRDGLSFRRTVNVTVNADSSRQINVDVISLSSKFEGRAQLSTTYPVWGSQ